MAPEAGSHFCEGCGLEVAPNAKFCKGCGRRVGVASEPPINPVPPVAGPGVGSRATPDPTTAVIPKATPPEPPLVPPISIPPSSVAPEMKADRHSDLKDSKWVIVGGVAALVVVAGIVLVVLHSRSSSTNSVATLPPHASTVPTTASTIPPSTTTSTAPVSGRREAAAINTLLAQSSGDHDAIDGATTDIANCGNLSQDEATLNAAAQSRRTLIAELPRLDTSQITGAAQLISALRSAWQASAESDSSYAAWAGDLLTSGCTGQATTNDPNWQAAQVSDPEATAAKQQLAAAWTPIAIQYGFPQYTYNQL